MQVTPQNPASLLSPKSLQLAPEDLLADDLFAAMQVALLSPDRPLSSKPLQQVTPHNPASYLSPKSTQLAPEEDIFVSPRPLVSTDPLALFETPREPTEPLTMLSPKSAHRLHCQVDMFAAKCLQVA